MAQKFSVSGLLHQICMFVHDDQHHVVQSLRPNALRYDDSDLGWGDMYDNVHL